MYKQTVDVAKDDSVTMSGETKTYELENAGILSYIDLLVEFETDASGADFVKNIVDWLTTIEVVGNSTDILLSLDARELAALLFSMTRRPVLETRSEAQNVKNYLHIPIPFGRYLWDPEYALDLSKWDLVELNITNGDSDTGNFFDTGDYTVREKFIRDGPAPTGYFKTYEANAWTPPSATGEKTVDFPKDYLIRQAIISVLPTYPARNAAYTKEMYEVLDQIKFTYKSGNVVVFDEDTEELMRQNADEFGLVDMGGVVQADDADYFSTDLGWTVDGVLAVEDPSTQATSLETVAGLSNFNEARLKINEINATAGQVSTWKARGYAYMLALFLHFDMDNSMANLLDPKAEETVRLKYTAGATNGKVRTVLQQVRS